MGKVKQQKIGEETRISFIDATHKGPRVIRRVTVPSQNSVEVGEAVAANLQEIRDLRKA